MNPQVLDFVIRTVTTALLSLVIIGVAAYEVVSGGQINAEFGSFVGLVIGFYFGAHVSTNGSLVRAASDARLVAVAQGAPIPPPETLHVTPPAEQAPNG